MAGPVYFTGGATAVAKVMTATPANVEVNDIFTLLVGGVPIAVFTATAATVLNVTAGLTAAWDASGHGYATGITATDSTTHVTLTSDVEGMDFIVTATAVEGGVADTQTLTMATTTANAGPNDWRSTGNWDTGAIPVNADEVTIADTSIDICWGLDQNAVDLTTLNIEDSYTGRIGLDPMRYAISANGRSFSTPQLPEYREDYLKIGWADGFIGKQSGQRPGTGSDRLKLYNDKPAAARTYIYHSAAVAAEVGTPSLKHTPANAAHEIYIYGGNVGMGGDVPGETGTCSFIHVVPEAGRNPRLIVGDGLTWVTFKQWGGATFLDSGGGNPTLVECNGGTLTTQGDDWDATTIDIFGGLVIGNNYDDDGDDILAATVNGYAGALDLQQNSHTRTITTLNLKKPGFTFKTTPQITITTLNEPSDRNSTLTVT